jgi:hypothetical protein
MSPEQLIRRSYRILITLVVLFFAQQCLQHCYYVGPSKYPRITWGD